MDRISPWRSLSKQNSSQTRTAKQRSMTIGSASGSRIVSRAPMLMTCMPKRTLTEMAVKDVHKEPQLDIVGWFTLGPASGPEPHLLPIHSRISEVYTESPLLVLFHPENAFSEETAAGKLPLTVYESVSISTSSEPNDKVMDVDGAVQPKSTKFRELVYSIETGEAEMISVDFVARGGGNATAVEGSVDVPVSNAEASTNDEDAGKRSTRGKQKEKEKIAEDAPIEESQILSADDEESKSIPKTVDTM